MAISPEQEALLNSTFEELPDITHRSKAIQIDIIGDRQRYLANPDSIYEVAVAGKAVSGPEEEQNFDKALRFYNQLINRHEAQLTVTHILNGARTVILRSPVVKVKDKPINPVGIEWEDE